jgi:hypothetical protein
MAASAAPQEWPPSTPQSDGDGGKAERQFRRMLSLTASVKSLEAVGQTALPVFLVVRLLGSASGPSRRMSSFETCVFGP